jgi:hypothetical protein
MFCVRSGVLYSSSFGKIFIHADANYCNNSIIVKGKITRMTLTSDQNAL